MIPSLLLGVRMIATGGRHGAARHALFASAMALSTIVVLTMLAIPGVVDSQADRLSRQRPELVGNDGAIEPGSTPPMKLVLESEAVDNRLLTRLIVGDVTDSATRPSWLESYPAVGEVAVSPALAEMILTNTSGMADRFPQHVVQVIGDDGLVSPDQLLAVVGVASIDLPIDAPGVVAARGLGVDMPTREGPDERVVRILALGGVIFVAIPTALMIVTMARLSARTRQRRLAAPRLIGLTSTQASTVNSVEVAMVGGAGALAGAAIWRLLVPVSQETGIGSLKWFSDDVRVGASTVVVVVMGLFVLSLLASIIGARRALVEPLNERRSAPTAAFRSRRLVPLGTGFALLTVAAVRPAATNTWFVVFAAGNVLVAVGLYLALPLIAKRVGDALASRSRHTVAHLAGRRLQHDPGGVERVASGLLAVVLVAAFAQTLLVTLDWAATRNLTEANNSARSLLQVQNAEIEPDRLDATVLESSLPILTLKSVEGEDVTAIVASCGELAGLAASGDQQACNGEAAQPLISAAGIRLTADDGSAMPIEFRYQDGGTAAPAMFRLPPSHPLATSATATRWIVSLVPGASNVTATNEILGLHPAAQINGIPSPDRGRLVSTYRTLVNVSMAGALVLVLVSVVGAVVDRGQENKRLSKQLTALGVGSRDLRMLEAIWLAAPTFAGVLLAASAAAIAAVGYARIDDAPVSFPARELALVLGIGAAGFLAAATAAAIGAPTDLDDRIESDA